MEGRGGYESHKQHHEDPQWVCLAVLLTPRINLDRNICVGNISLFRYLVKAGWDEANQENSIFLIMSVSLARVGCHEVRLAPRSRICRRAVLNIRHNSNTVSEAEQQNLTWPEYLEIRKSKRKWETVRYSSWNSCSRFLIGCERMIGCYHPGMYPRVGGRTCVLWFSGVRRNEAYHGA